MTTSIRTISVKENFRQKKLLQTKINMENALYRFFLLLYFQRSLFLDFLKTLDTFSSIFKILGMISDVEIRNKIYYNKKKVRFEVSTF